MPWWDKYVVDSNRSLASCDWHGLTGIESFGLGSQSTVHLGDSIALLLLYCDSKSNLSQIVQFHMVVECFSLVSGLHNASDAKVYGSLYLYLNICIHICPVWSGICWRSQRYKRQILSRLRQGAHLFPSLHHGPQLLHGLAGAQWTHELGLLQLKTNGSYLPVIPSWWSRSASHFS